MQYTRKGLMLICIITVFFIISACVNSYAAQISSINMLPDTDAMDGARGFGNAAMCVPPETDHSDRNEKLTSSNDFYIRVSKTESMIFCNCIDAGNCTDTKSNAESDIKEEKAESLTGQVIMRC